MHTHNKSSGQNLNASKIKGFKSVAPKLSKLFEFWQKATAKKCSTQM